MSAPSPSAPTVREASKELRRYWVFGGEPQLAVYGDLETLLHTELFEGLLPAALAEAGELLKPKQRDCVTLLAQSAREVAVGKDSRGTLVLLRLSAERVGDLRSACVGSLFPVDRSAVKGADEAYASGADVVVVEPGMVLYGPQPLVEAALQGAQAADFPALELREDQQLRFQFALQPEVVASSGALRVRPDRFGLEAEVELASDDLASRAEAELSQVRAATLAMASAAGPLLEGLKLRRDGRRLRADFQLRGTAAEQAQGVGTLLALAAYGVRSQLRDAKAAEARATLARIAKSYAVTWSQPAAAAGDAKARPAGSAKVKKLISLPPVPATVPRGVKYQSAPEDWQAWQAIGFSLTQPQYYQYEVVAAKDDHGIVILARGDLDGDGRASLFRLELKFDRKTQTFTALQLAETDASQ